MSVQTFTFSGASGWTNSTLALSSPSVSYAQAVAAKNNAATSELVITTPSAASAGTFFVDGIEVDITSQSSSSVPTFLKVQIANDIGASSNLAGGKAFGSGPTFSLNPISTTFGSSTNSWSYVNAPLSKFLSNFALTIQGTNPSTTTDYILTVWYVEMTLHLSSALTAQQVVERAFRKTGLLSKDTTIETVDLSHGIDLLNDMMFGWEMLGIDINHTELASSDAVPLPRKFIEGTVMQLASRVSQDYQVPQVASDRFFASLSRAYNLDYGTDYRDDDADGTVSEAEIEQDKVSRFF